VAIVLVCSPVSLQRELSQTMLSRSEVESREVGRFDEAVSMALAVHPSLVLIHHALPRRAELVASLRGDSRTRSCSIVVVAESGVASGDLQLLQSGVNAVLHLPGGPQWDAEIQRMLSVAPRREARLAVQFAVEAMFEGRRFTGYTVNLSVSSMLLQSPVDLSVGDSLTFSIVMQTGRVEGTGTVVRQAADEKYGVFFDHLEAPGREHIERHLRSLA
jgi:CheY-like chemotaxis protein